MTLNATTDYAIQIIIALDREKKILSAQKLADLSCVSKRYVMLVAAKLRDHNLIETVSGIFGGYKLAKPGSQISLFDIIDAMEGKFCLYPCIYDHSVCKSNDKNCQILPIYRTIHDRIVDCLRGLSIDTINRVPREELHELTGALLDKR